MAIVVADAKSPKENKLDFDLESNRGNTIKQRFWNKIRENFHTDCWEWLGTTTGNNGYGSMRISTQETAYVHRLSYVMYKGKIPPDMKVLHTCDNPVCCNPNHLFLGTQLDNIKDRDMKGHCRNRYSVKQLGSVNVQEGGTP